MSRDDLFSQPPSPEAAEQIAQVVREYGSQADYLERVGSAVESRTQQVTEALREAFASVIRVEEIEVIDFSALNVMALGEALAHRPVVLKPLLSVCNVAGRALERDLDLKNIDTYNVRLTSPQAHAIAGYIKNFLPPTLPLAALTHMDRVSYIDKEIRAHKGQWERLITRALVRFSGLPFKKAKFLHGNQSFELDSAYVQGGRVVYGVDVKRIEARRDIHKRSDEIVNKAIKLKEAHSEAKFGAVIYYPFTLEQGNIRDRMSSPAIDSVQFAGETESSINNAVRLLLGKFGVSTTEGDA